ncbi:MAG TPA: hypothetical protein VI172_14770 [Candidatus Dormibacteraeota bacterium]
MTITGYYTCTATGALTDDSILTINGVDYPIPAMAKVGGRLGPRRLQEAYTAAGYRAATDYRSDLGYADDGRGTIQLVPLDAEA